MVVAYGRKSCELDNFNAFFTPGRARYQSKRRKSALVMNPLASALRSWSIAAQTSRFACPVRSPRFLGVDQCLILMLADVL